jgi:hypothetical protein
MIGLEVAKKFKVGEIQALLKASAKKMKILAQDAIDRIQLDASGGIFQSGSEQGPTGFAGRYNKQYEKYKRNGMRRFSDNKKLKAYRGRRSTNTETRVVNMKLTGDTFRGMTARGKADVGQIAYRPEHTKLVLGNQDRGYDIYNLSPKNLQYIIDRFDQVILDPALKKYMQTKTTI